MNAKDTASFNKFKDAIKSRNKDTMKEKLKITFVALPKVDMTCCGIFVRNEKKVQLNWLETHPAGGNVIGGKTFKTFGKAARVAWNMGFRVFETDDGNILPLNVHVVQIANR